VIAPPLAHETWFVGGPHSDWSFAGEPLTLAYLLAAFAIALAVRVIARRFPGVDVPFLARMTPWMPFALRMHLAVSLISLLGLGFYLSPAMDLHWTVAGVVLGAVMVLAAIGLASGWHTREAAWLLVAAGPLGLLEFGVSPVIQRVDMLGPALFLLIAGPGRWSADHELGRAPGDVSPEALARALWALKVAVGVALIVVAFAEKLANPGLALDFLRHQPDFNVAQGIGLPLGDLEFARLAGAIEVLFGLLVISSALPQAIVLIAGIPFNATLFFYGEIELSGHLPIYGTMLALLVYGSDSRTRPLVTGPWPFGRSTIPSGHSGGRQDARRARPA
jgi:hypothetical protein